MGNCTRCGSPIDYTSAFCMCDRCQRNADLPRHQSEEIARLRAELQAEREAHVAMKEERDTLKAVLARAVECLQKTAIGDTGNNDLVCKLCGAVEANYRLKHKPTCILADPLAQSTAREAAAMRSFIGLIRAAAESTGGAVELGTREFVINALAALDATSQPETEGE